MSLAVVIQPGNGFECVTFETRDALPPVAGEISVRIRASSLNYHDYNVVRGKRASRAPRVPMADGAGEVTAIGPGVTSLAVGDPVVSVFFPTWNDGQPPVEGFAEVPGDGVDGYGREVVTTSAAAFTKAPKGYSHAQAATMTTAGLTAWRALFEDAHLKAGDVVLTQGTGGVSIFALQFAKLAGATVIATSSSDEKLQKLESLGADHLINYRTDADWGRTARRLSGGRGVDHVLDVGGAATLAQSLVAVRVAGHVSVIGVLGGVAGDLSVIPVLLKQPRLQGVLVGSRRQQIAMVRAIDANGLRPVIDSHYPLKDIVAAFRHMESGRHFGKICLDI